MPHSERRKQIVILGGGFAGVEAARHLDRTVAKELEDVEVTLVSRENFFTFTPMLHEVTAGDLEPTDICNPLRKLFRRVNILTGNTESIDFSEHLVTISYGIRELRRTLRFDHLVLALGSETNFFGIPGAAERAVGIKSLGDASMLRAGVIGLLETASVEPDPDRRKSMLTFVIAGGGFAGVEIVGAINDLARESLPHYSRIDPREVRVVLIHGGQFILPELGEALGRYAQEKLSKRHVEIKLGAKVTGYADGAVQCDDGETIPAGTLVWAAGVSPSPILKELPLELQKGRVVVGSTLEVPGRPGVWAAGDRAAITDPISKMAYPPTAQHALRQGRLVGRNIRASLKGKKPTPFRYKAPGQLASIGRRIGVARIYGMKFSGIIGWILWRTVYLTKLPRLEKKLRVGLQWMLDVVFERDLAQYLTIRDAETLNRLLDGARKAERVRP